VEIEEALERLLELMKEYDRIVEEMRKLRRETVKLPNFNFGDASIVQKLNGEMVIPDITRNGVVLERETVEEIRIDLGNSVSFKVYVERGGTTIFFREFKLASSRVEYLAETLIFIRENYDTLKRILEEAIEKAKENLKEMQKLYDDVRRAKALLEILFS